MTPGVMPLDMLKLRRAPKRTLVPIQLPHPLVQRRVPGPNVANVALEMLHVHGVEADDGGVETDVCFGDVFAVVVRARGRGEVTFGAVEGSEEFGDRCFVGFLCSVKIVSLTVL